VFLIWPARPAVTKIILARIVRLSKEPTQCSKSRRQFPLQDQN